jgi:hypothetical protein
MSVALPPQEREKSELWAAVLPHECGLRLANVSCNAGLRVFENVPEPFAIPGMTGFLGGLVVFARGRTLAVTYFRADRKEDS